MHDNWQGYHFPRRENHLFSERQINLSFLTPQNSIFLGGSYEWESVAFTDKCGATDTSGILISGGSADGELQDDVEMIIPDTGTTKTCSQMTLPSPRSRHTLDTVNSKPVICGGEGHSRSCIEFSDGSWSDYYSPLIYGRTEATSWVTPQGLVLMGGWGSLKTTEIIPGDGSSKEKFGLKLNTAYAVF